MIARTLTDAGLDADLRREDETRAAWRRRKVKALAARGKVAAIKVGAESRAAERLGAALGIDQAGRADHQMNAVASWFDRGVAACIIRSRAQHLLPASAVSMLVD